MFGFLVIIALYSACVTVKIAFVVYVVPVDLEIKGELATDLLLKLPLELVNKTLFIVSPVSFLVDGYDTNLVSVRV